MTSILLILCAVVAAAALCGYLFVHVRIGWRMVAELSHPKRAALPDRVIFDCRVRQFRFSSARGISLSAVVYEPPSAAAVRGTILAFHYLGGSKAAIFPYVGNLVRHGYRVASFDYPNHGESEDCPSSRYTFESDLRRFLEVLEREKMEGPYGAIGFSMGASLALMAADFCPQVKAVVCDSGPLLHSRKYFLHVLRSKREVNWVVRAVFMASYLFLMGFYPRERSMLRRLQRLRGLPMLYLHGRRDHIVSIDNARRAYALSRSDNSRFVAVDRAHHLTNRALLGPHYDQLVLQFFNRWIS